MTFLKIHQIFFDESQKPKLEPEYIPHFNPRCSIYFENEPIVKLIREGAHKDCQYFGVVSYSLRDKLTQTKQWKAIFRPNENVNDFTPSGFESWLKFVNQDAASLMFHPSQDQIKIAERFHPGFTTHWIRLTSKMGLNWKPEIWEWASYSNFFVAKSEIYEDYVNTWLVPAIAHMTRMPQLCSPCGYNGHEYPEKLTEETGYPHYTWHPFLLERLFAYYVHVNKLRAMSF